MPFGMPGTRVWGIAIPIKFARKNFPVFGDNVYDSRYLLCREATPSNWMKILLRFTESIHPLRRLADCLEKHFKLLILKQYFNSENSSSSKNLNRFLHRLLCILLTKTDAVAFDKDRVFKDARIDSLMVDVLRVLKL